jgi:hypothetical protein
VTVPVAASFLASKSSSSEARADLAKAIPALLGLKGRDELHTYIDDLERRFQAAWNSFSPQDQDEIAFTLSLERASVHYLFHEEGKSSEYEEIRGEYFRKTTERAFAKAERSGGVLVCYVGGNHANLHDFGPDDYPTARIPEAKYFNTEYPASRGRIGSILIERIQEAGQGTLEAAALALMRDKERIFIDLRVKNWGIMNIRPAAFFSQNEPKYDGVLFIK